MPFEPRKGPSGPPFTLDTDSIINESTLPGQTLTDVLDTINDAAVAVPPGYPPTPSGGSTAETAARPGFTSRHVFVNALSDRIGTEFCDATVEAAPAGWFTEEDLPPGREFVFTQYGAASGAGSGSANGNSSGTFTTNGGSPSGGGAINSWRISRAALIAALPVFFNLPLGGLGGAAVTGGNLVHTDGLPGATVSDQNTVTGVGIDERAGSSSAGTGGTSGNTGTAGSGGGRVGNAISSTQGGSPFDAGPTVSNTIFTFQGGARSNTRTSTGSGGTMNWSIWGGAGGGSNGNSTSIVHGGRSKYGGGGGGHGGRWVNLSGQVAGSSDGGNHDVSLSGNPGGGGGGLGGINSGDPGQDGADGNETRCGEGAGGGMAGQGNTGPTATGGNGGDGGFPGGGAGGGGAGYRSGPGTATSGPGGKGGDAATMITGY